MMQGRGQRQASVDSLKQRVAAAATNSSFNVSERSQRRFLVGRCVEKYQEQFSFLRDSRFLQDLENDSVDSDLIEEELRALRESGISSKREKIVKFLQSNPVQVLLCVIVLLDAGIVIAQILLDLNSVKDKLQIRERQLSDLMRFIRGNHSSSSTSGGQYNGENIDEFMRLLFLHDFRPDVYQHHHNGLSTNASAAMLSPPPLGTANHDDATEKWIASADHDTSTVLQPSATSEDRKSASSSEFHPPIGGHIELLDSTNDLAHVLHFASIGMLGILVIEDLVKIIAMGKTFCRHKIEIFDAIIIGSSFAIDIIFLGGVSGEEGQKAAAVLVVLLLWRIARVVDGIVVTVKQRQEFRIRLQKRARRAAERKLDTFMEDQQAKTKQIEALKDLCLKAGIKDSDIAACAPHCIGPVSSTLSALSSVARLSVSMTMLMSSGAHRAAVRSLTPLAAVAAAAAASEGPPTTNASGETALAAGQGSTVRGLPSIADEINGIVLACSGTISGKTGSFASAIVGGLPTPPPHKLHHLWNSNRGVLRRPAAGPVGSGGRVGRPPSRIESLPNMIRGLTLENDEDDVVEKAGDSNMKADDVSGGKKYNRNSAGRKKTGHKFLPLRGQSLSNGNAVTASDVFITAEESSTSCDEDSSDGLAMPASVRFDVIREETTTRSPVIADGVVVDAEAVEQHRQGQVDSGPRVMFYSGSGSEIDVARSVLPVPPVLTTAAGVEEET